MLDELEARRFYLYHLSRPQLLEKLQSILHGIQRSPALYCLEEDILDHLSLYEIPACETLHDLSNVVQHIITKLPTHFEDKSVEKEFSTTTIGDKNQIRGSDARLFAIKLAKFTMSLYNEKRISINILELCTSLVEITAICYMHYNQRSPKQIVRLYNQTFKSSYLCKSIIGKPKRMTARKFYGSHFHSLTVMQHKQTEYFA